MAMQEANPASAPTAEVVGHAFVEQYYQILHQSPNLVHRFYQDSSFLSRPDSYGVMKAVTTMEAINEKIMSLNYNEYTAEIKTADAQESYEKGVIVLVTGCLTGKDDVGKKFTQTFFLAPQDKGYYVLNDVFRFVEEHDRLHVDAVSPNPVNENYETTEVLTETEVINALDHTENSISVEVENIDNGGEVYNPLENEEERSVVEEENVEPTAHVPQNEVVSGEDSAPAAQDDTPKKSYASIVKVMNNITVSGPVHGSAHNVNVASAKVTQRHPTAANVSLFPEGSASTAESATGNTDDHEEAEGHSIYIRNLPYDATVEQLETVFKKFGPIKHDGIQVRSSKQGFCFGFVEFVELSSMQSALEASPIKIGDRQAVVEEKRTTTRVSGSGRGRYPSGRSGFRNENYRMRGKFSGGRGYARYEFKNQEYSSRPRGSTGNSDISQWATLNGGGRSGRQAGASRN